jgi:PKD repeat protein
MRCYFFFCFVFFFGNPVNAQNWQSIHGGNSKSNLSPHSGIQDITTPLWTVQNASAASLGGNTYSYGNHFVTTRWDINQGKSVVECRNLLTGTLLWTSPNLGAASKLHAVAFNEDAVYAHDYDDNIRLFYALNPHDGSVLWAVPSYTFGPLDSPIFDCERNPIINTSLDEFNQDASLIHCINKSTGEVIWTVQDFVVLLPNKVKAAYENKLYMISGSAIDPKKLVAIDMNSGQILYYSDPIPGQASQHIHPIIDKDGVIYVVRDGGSVFSFTDSGTGFELNWQYEPMNFSLSTIPAIDQNGHFVFVDNGRVKRLDKNTGAELAQSDNNTFAPESTLMVSKDGIIHINNRNGDFYALSNDLQEVLWQFSPGGGNYYSLPHLSTQGIMILAGSGTTITAFQRTGDLPPVGDFQAAVFLVNAGASIQFNDQSSNNPTAWTWSFEGGTPNNSSEANPLIIYNQAGVYDVSLIVSNANGTDTISKSCYIAVDGSVSIAEHDSNLSFQVFPNPFEDYLFLKTSSISLPLTFDLYDISGKKISSFVVTQNGVPIDLSLLNPGIYFLQCTTSRFESVKIVKQ